MQNYEEMMKSKQAVNGVVDGYSPFIPTIPDRISTIISSVTLRVGMKINTKSIVQLNKEMVGHNQVRIIYDDGTNDILEIY